MAMVARFAVGFVVVLLLLVAVFPVMTLSANVVKVWHPVPMTPTAILVFVVLLLLEVMVRKAVIVVQVIVCHVVAVTPRAIVIVLVLTRGLLFTIHVDDLRFRFPCRSSDLMVAILVGFPVRQINWRRGCLKSRCVRLCHTFFVGLNIVDMRFHSCQCRIQVCISERFLRPCILRCWHF